MEVLLVRQLNSTHLVFKNFLVIQSFISKARSLAIEDNNGNDTETRRCNPLLLEIRD